VSLKTNPDSAKSDFEVREGDSAAPVMGASSYFGASPKSWRQPKSAGTAPDSQIASAAFESGRVLLPKSAPWLTEYLTELAASPGSKHDDQVDSTTQALDYITGTVYEPSTTCSSKCSVNAVFSG
jgi:hypothetical protein